MASADLENLGLVDLQKLDLADYLQKLRFADYFQTLNLADYFQYGMKIADLSESEREVVNDLLKRTLGKNPK